MLREYWPLVVELSHDFTQYHEQVLQEQLRKVKSFKTYIFVTAENLIAL